MRKLNWKPLLAAAALVLWAGSSLAANVNPNGFPSGEHFNLNINGKKDAFSCPDVELDEFGNPVYGNVVYVPETGEGIKIYMESGKGKKAAAVSELQVTDPCSGFDGDGAVLKLPKNEAGYRVYARALAKPTDNPDITISPELVAVEDESGNDLVYLGLVTDNGFETPTVSFSRKKGKSKAVDISGLFAWSGSVCYFSEPDGGYQSTLDLCCLDADFDGVWEECVEPAVDPLTDLAGCGEGYATMTAFCSEYTDEWVFNVGDFVTYLWNASNNGVKLLQVRFYPN